MLSYKFKPPSLYANLLLDQELNLTASISKSSF